MEEPETVPVCQCGEDDAEKEKEKGRVEGVHTTDTHNGGFCSNSNKMLTILSSVSVPGSEG